MQAVLNSGASREKFSDGIGVNFGRGLLEANVEDFFGLVEILVVVLAMRSADLGVGKVVRLIFK